MSRLKTISLALFAALSSCQLVNLEQIAFVTFPEVRDAVLGPATAVWIEFSLPVQKAAAEALCRVDSPAGSVTGDFSWSSRRLIFTPQAAYEPGMRYVFSFKGEVKTDDGRRFPIATTVPFFSVSADLPPRLVSSLPAAGAMIGGEEELAFRFSKSMDATISIDEVFRLAPSADFSHAWSEDGTELTISPDGWWTPLERYAWTITTACKDTTGVRLTREYAGGFLVQDPAAPAPVVLSLEPVVNSLADRYPLIPLSVPLTSGARQEDWIGFKDAIRINFQFASPPAADDPARIDSTSLEGAFSLDPPLPGRLQCVKTLDGLKDDFFVFIPDPLARFLKNTLYKVKISRTLSNRAGLTAREDFEAWFTAAVPRIAVERITVTNNQPDDLIVSAAQCNSYLPFPVTTSGAQPCENFIIDFNAVFSLNDADRYAAADKISLTKVFPEAGVAYEKRNVVYLPGNPNRLTVTFDGVPVVEGGVFRLLIEGGPDGLADNHGGYLDDDVFIYFFISGVIP